jgi:hypothetical protein
MAEFSPMSSSLDNMKNDFPLSLSWGLILTIAEQKKLPLFQPLALWRDFVNG